MSNKNISKEEIVSKLDNIRYECEEPHVLNKLHKLRRAVAKDAELEQEASE